MDKVKEVVSVILIFAFDIFLLCLVASLIISFFRLVF